jgi:F-type H+-transporting ATPase subunit alpha
MTAAETNLIAGIVEQVANSNRRILQEHTWSPHEEELGVVASVGEGIAQVAGLPSAKSQELLKFVGGRLGMAFNLDPHQIGVILLDEPEGIPVGSPVSRSGEVVSVPVGEALLGRIVDAMGRPLDDRGKIDADRWLPIEQQAPALMDRDPVKQPLQTGLKVVDSLIPIGRGQRELIIGDRQTGKSAIALDTIINQDDVICIYCSIGQKGADVAKFVADLEKNQAMDYCIIVVAAADSPPGLQFVAPYAATSMGEYFRDRGRDVLIVYDDLTSHARAYRELSLLLRRPPGREAYPGDIFYVHSRLLERSTHLSEDNNGGSLTALPIVETQAQNISAYLPTNLISITDGQIYLSPKLFRKGILPAVDVGKSVSRVGGKTQLPSYHEIAGDLRLAYTQFEELETFSRFSTRLDEETRQRLNHGRRVREIFKQPRYQPLSVPRQIMVLLAVSEGLFDQLSLEQIGPAEEAIYDIEADELDKIAGKIREGESLEADERESLLELIRKALSGLQEEEEGAHADT